MANAYRERWILRPASHGMEREGVRLDRRHVYILPTKQGAGFAVILLLMLIGAINYSNSLGYMLTFLLTAMGLVTMLHTYRNLVGLHLSAGRSPAVFAGERARFALRLEGEEGVAHRSLAVRLKEETPRPVEVAAGGSGSAELTRLAERRGRLPLGRFRVESDYPLGLFRAWSWLDLERHCLVYPRPEPPGTPLPAATEGEGVGRSAGVGEEDFAGLRAYRPGDPLRHVAWKAVAKGQPMLTKQFDGAEASRLWLDWADLHGMGEEARLSRLCRWVLDAELQGAEYGLRLPGTSVDPARGEAHRRACLESLALYRLEG
ncbi:DUF58 domain-containing protein [Endothiovibrio diazotrophicus]